MMGLWVGGVIDLQAWSPLLAAAVEALAKDPAQSTDALCVGIDVEHKAWFATEVLRAFPIECKSLCGAEMPVALRKDSLELL